MKNGNESGARYHIIAKINIAFTEGGKTSKLDMDMDIQLDELDYSGINRAISDAINGNMVNGVHRRSRQNQVTADK